MLFFLTSLTLLIPEEYNTTTHAAFDGILCVDAMEFIAPEEWPPVLNNFHRALKRDGYLYFTVELLEAEELDHAYREGQKQGLPVVEGEYAHEGYYH